MTLPANPPLLSNTTSATPPRHLATSPPHLENDNIHDQYINHRYTAAQRTGSLRSRHPDLIHPYQSTNALITTSHVSPNQRFPIEGLTSFNLNHSPPSSMCEFEKSEAGVSFSLEARPRSLSLSLSLSKLPPMGQTRRASRCTAIPYLCSPVHK
jgi:hypothetical protein